MQGNTSSSVPLSGRTPLADLHGASTSPKQHMRGGPRHAAQWPTSCSVMRLAGSTTSSRLITSLASPLTTLHTSSLKSNWGGGAGGAGPEGNK